MFVWVFLTARKITHEPLHVARWNFARTCSLITARTLLNFKVIGRRSKSQDQITGFSPLRDRAFVSTITHKPLNSGWWYLVRTCTSTTSSTRLNFKVIGHRFPTFGSPEMWYDARCNSNCHNCVLNNFYAHVARQFQNPFSKKNKKYNGTYKKLKII